jgi:hypothetical protein
MMSDDDKQWIGGQFADMRGQFADIRGQLADITERMELMETRLLTEFHRWAQTYEVRARGTSRAVAEFDERLGLVEERLARLERAKTA